MSEIHEQRRQYLVDLKSWLDEKYEGDVYAVWAWLDTPREELDGRSPHTILVSSDWSPELPIVQRLLQLASAQ